MGFLPWFLCVEDRKGETEGAGEDCLGEGKKSREWSRPEIKKRGEGTSRGEGEMDIDMVVEDHSSRSLCAGRRRGRESLLSSEGVRGLGPRREERERLGRREGEKRPGRKLGLG
jgi:hypothetical protein